MHVPDSKSRVADKPPNIEGKRRSVRHCGYPQCEFTARAMSSVEEHYISRHTSERPFICTYNADLDHLNGGSGYCGASYATYRALFTHSSVTGHHADSSESEIAYVVAQQSCLCVPHSGTPSPQASQRSKPTRHIDATVAPVPVPAHPPAAVALSPLSPWSTAAQQASVPSSLLYRRDPNAAAADATVSPLSPWSTAAQQAPKPSSLLCTTTRSKDGATRGGDPVREKSPRYT
ncbi:hypothetical protein VTO73DRAFT_12835 [Trametes versicolor]